MRILYLGLSPREETHQQILTGLLPSDRLYGIVELQRLGYDVSFECMRPQGQLGALVGYFNSKFGFNLPRVKTLLNLRNYDVIVLNGPMCTLITIACLVFGKKLVYLDSILRLPKSICRKLIYRYNLKLSNGTIMYSKTQMNQCIKTFKVQSNCFTLMPFGIDFSFYQQIKSNIDKNKRFVLAVGRDQARDYGTLVQAMEGLEVKLKLVTLPYLLKGVDLNHDWTEVLENVSYKELCQLYAEALFVVIPLKRWGTNYSSGTRALLEAKAMGKTVIASYSLPLEEYMGQNKGVFYVEPENVEELRKNIVMLLENQDEWLKYDIYGKETVRDNFSMDVFAHAFGSYITGLLKD